MDEPLIPAVRRLRLPMAHRRYADIERSITTNEGDLTWQARPSSRWSATSSTTRSCASPLRVRPWPTSGRLHAAHLRQADQRVEGRRRAVPVLLGLATGGGERRRVAEQGHARRGPGPAEVAHVRDPRGREAHRLRDRGRRGRPVAEVRHRQGHPHPARSGGGGGYCGGGGRPADGGDPAVAARSAASDPWASSAAAGPLRAARASGAGSAAAPATTRGQLRASARRAPF